MLDDDALQNILDDWSTWSKRPPKSIPRALASHCNITAELVTVIQGVRHCGKSTLLRQLLGANDIPEHNAVFINFEDPRLIGYLDFQEYKQMVKSGNLMQFIRQGGFPAALTFPEPKKLLQQYFQGIVEKDIRERVSAKSSRPLQAVAKMVMESVGSELSLRRIAGAIQLSPETVNHYLQACEDAYLLFSCPYFAYSESKRVRHNKKYYAVDTALRRAVSTKAGEDLGKDFENLVYLLLRRKTPDICYWKGKGEVDFVVSTNNGTTTRSKNFSAISLTPMRLFMSHRIHLLNWRRWNCNPN